MTVDLFIFDCDGVLVDSEPVDDAAVQAALRECGIDPQMFSREVLGAAYGKGLSDEDMWKAIGDHVGGLPDGLVPAYLRLRDEAMASVAAMPLALEAVEDIRGMVTVCVASSGSHEKMAITLGGTALLPLFRGRVYSATQVEHGNPAPDLFLYAAAQSGVDPEDCVVIEDSANGVRASVAAGMQTLGYCPDGDVNGLGALGARVFPSHERLPEIIYALRVC
jgi:HAD superfamily hydrolase (TIGR01509 family)